MINMNKRILIALICILALVLAGCSSGPKLKDTFRSEELDRLAATELGGALSYSGLTENYKDGETVPFKQIFPYFLNYGFYGGEDTIRPELERYKKDDKYVVPAKVVDRYLTAHFPTEVDHTGIESYDEKKDCYTLTPLADDGSRFYMLSMKSLRDHVYEVMMRDTDPADPKLGTSIHTYNVTIEFIKDSYRFLGYEYVSVNYVRPDQKVADENGIHWYSPALPSDQRVTAVYDGFKEDETYCLVTEDGGEMFKDVITRKQALRLALAESTGTRYDLDGVDREFVATEGGANDVELIRIESTFDAFWKPEWESDSYDFKADPLLWMVRLVDKKEPAVSIYIYLDINSGEVMGAGTLTD